ncbi:hypothetical protein [Pelagibius sp.]|uniref:hypothetical protein n=1 Tax=Pelagibius sp. TaxID=1931238 RepID=UPI002603AF13|nr:hypothetical protein [Pelagibius sp.]
MCPRATRLILARTATAAALMLSALPAAAAVDTVQPSPNKAQVAATGASSIAVTWRVGRSIVSMLPSPGTIGSQRAELLINGSVVATIGRRLEQTTEGEQTPETFLFRETVSIPQSLVYRAIKQESPIVIRRSFEDSVETGSEDGEVLVVPAGPGSAEFSVQRVSLSFFDDSRTQVLPKNGDLRAVAEINTTGASLLTGVWEVASGSSTAGTPVFRPLTLVRQGIAASGRTVVTSPRLPTATEGTNLVRFRITNPETDFRQPILQYYVTPPSATVAVDPLREILLSGPRPGEALTEKTRFAWTALAGAATYHLELFTAPAGPAAPVDTQAVRSEIPLDPSPETGQTDDQVPLAGIFVQGSETEARLADFTLAQLPGDRRYLWKISAIDAKGAVIGSSSVREIYKP